MKNSDHRPNIESPPKHGEGRRAYDASRDEEYAEEVAAGDYTSRNTPEVISMYGWIGLALSIISFFMWPLVFGIAGIILGFVSRNKGAEMLGNVAIAAGVISIIISLLMIPF